MKRFAELIKTTVVCVLLVSLTCLSFIYMNTYKNVNVSTFSVSMDKSVREKLYKAGYVELMDAELVYPYFISVTGSNGTKGFWGDSASALYRELSGVVSAIISPESNAYKSSESDFLSCVDSYYAYIKYRAELPKSVIYYVQNHEKILEESSEEYISEMFIMEDEKTGDLYAVSRDFHGNCYMYRPEKIPNFNKRLVDSYNKRDEGYKFDFSLNTIVDDAMKSSGFYDKLYDLTVVPKDNVYLESAVVETGVVMDNGDINDALLLFGLNPEKVTSHSGDGETTYFVEGQNLKIGKETIEYSALSENAGVGISKILGYDYSDAKYSASDCVGATLMIAHSLGIADRGDFDLGITCAEVGEDNRITIGLSYLYKGVTVVTDREYALKIEFANGQIVSAEAFFASASAYDGFTNVSDADWKLRAYLKLSKARSDLRFAYYIENSRLSLSMVSCFEVTEGEK